MRRQDCSAWIRVGWALCAAAWSLVVPRPARAQSECPTDGGTALPPNYGQLLDFFPSDQASSVPLDGFVRLRYMGRAPTTPVVVVTETVSGLAVQGQLHVVSAEVHWQAGAPLRENTGYTVAVSDPAGGGMDTFTFTTGFRASSTSPPVFGGVDQGSASFVKNGESDLCGDPNAIEVTLTWSPAASNGWPPSDVEYVVYETRGPGVGGPVERARERGQQVGSSCSASGDRLCRSFRLSSQDASGPVCFNVQALDAYGRADGNAVEACVHPEVGNFFYGCSAAPVRSRRGRDGILAALGVGAMLGAWQRRRRRAGGLP